MSVASSLPPPSPEALAHSEKLAAHLRQNIDSAGGWLSFADWMAMALYAPGLGYYSAGCAKFGEAGDFVTAPGMTPLFGATVAACVAGILAQSAPHVLEVGAGTGDLAADLLNALAGLGQPPARYAILELSADLRARQQATLADRAPAWCDRVEWLDALPETWSGALVANELLDALPVHLLQWQADGIAERGVALDAEGAFLWQARPATGALAVAATALAEQRQLGGGYLSEIGMAVRAWVGDLARRLDRGGMLLIDYGFPRREYYHPERERGTLMCHYRHRTHDDALLWPGLQDITSHVDFTAVAEAAHQAGLDVLGYTGQAAFLMDAGLLNAMGGMDPVSPAYMQTAAAVQKLISPAEMGELFKVMLVGRGLQGPLPGFRRGDRTHTL